MQDDPPQDELDESQSDISDVDDNDATEISEAETEKPNTGDADSNGVEEPPQSLLLGDSLAGDIESIVASDIFVDEGLASVVLETDGSGSLLVQGSELKDNKEISGIESSGIIDSDSTIEGSDVGDAASEGGPFGIDYAKMTFWEFLFGVDEVKAWDVDLGEFLNDGEGDPVPTFTLKTFFEQDVQIIVLALVFFLGVGVVIVLLFCMHFGYV